MQTKLGRSRVKQQEPEALCPPGQGRGNAALILNRFPTFATTYIDGAMRAHWAANVLGRGVNRNGRFVLPW
jgi:hypothetical protein